MQLLTTDNLSTLRELIEDSQSKSITYAAADWIANTITIPPEEHGKGTAPYIVAMQILQNDGTYMDSFISASYGADGTITLCADSPVGVRIFIMKGVI